MGIEKRFDEVVNFILQKSMKESLQRIAEQRQISVAQLLREIIAKHLEKEN